jgi:hypothetical protein
MEIINNVAYTRGPWKVLFTRDRFEIRTNWKINYFQPPIAFMPDHKLDVQEQIEANANLIAAAPEMLGALKMASMTMRYYINMPEIQKTVDKIEALIATASSIKPGGMV